MRLNEGQIKNLSIVLKEKDLKKYISNFTDPKLHPPVAKNFKEYYEVINFFFATTVLNFKFWTIDKTGCYKPVYEVINGKKLKGSEILYAKAKKIFETSAEKFSLNFLLKITDDDCKFLKENLLPQDLEDEDKESRTNLLKEYAKSFKYCQPLDILNAVNQSIDRLKEFRTYLKTIAGYREDPLGKKIELLALILSCRPEKFLKIDINDYGWRPLTDYHWIRFALRTGMIIVDKKIAEILKTRKLINKKNHDQIRFLAYEANRSIKNYCGKNIVELDQYIWHFMRQNCDEEPRCHDCLFAKKCAKKVELYQPLYRTIFY